MILSASSRERYSRSLSSTESSLHVVSPPEPACKHKSVSATTSGKIAGGDRHRSHCATRNTDSPKERNKKKACLVVPRSMFKRQYRHMLVYVCLSTACVKVVAGNDTDDLRPFVRSFNLVAFVRPRRSSIGTSTCYGKTRLTFKVPKIISTGRIYYQL
jgi:hypothetical protein